MIDLTLTIDTTEGERELRLLADGLEMDAVDATLKRYGEAWLRGRVQSHFDERPGWPPLKAKAQKQAEVKAQGVEERAGSVLRRKLQRELNRAHVALGRMETSGGLERVQQRQAFLAAQGKKSRALSSVLLSRHAAIGRRELALKEFERLRAGGSTGLSLQGGKAGAKLVEKLAARFGRAVKREEQRGRPLGKIAQSFVLTVKDGRLVYGSAIPWAGVHNDGGTAGHGAKEPARPFAYLDPIDVEVLVSMLLNQGVGVLVH